MFCKSIYAKKHVFFIIVKVVMLKNDMAPFPLSLCKNWHFEGHKMKMKIKNGQFSFLAYFHATDPIS